MLRLQVYFVVLFILVSHSLSFAADDSNEQKRILRLATDAYRYFEYEKAAKYYERYLEKSSENASAHYHAGLCYDVIENPQKALLHYEKAYTLDPEVDKEILLKYAHALHLNNEFEKGEIFYKKYINDKKPSGKKRKEVDNLLYQCKNGKEFKGNPVKLEIVNLGKEVNSPEQDFGPAISKDRDTLYFSSRRRGASSGAIIQSTGLLCSDIYMSVKKGGLWGRALPVKGINTRSEEAITYLSYDGSTMIVYVGVSDKNSDLFLSHKQKNGIWSELVGFPRYINGSNSREVSAAMSRDQLTLIFSSDRSGGKGGQDLYYAIRESVDDEWSDPVNISALNTEFAEDSPFLDVDDKTLYFCSKGHKNMGGYDIFRSVYDSEKEAWSEPQNLGYPVNSAGNDIFFLLSADGKYAYFNSVKDEGIGAQDIYRMKMPEEIKTRALGEVEDDIYEPDFQAKAGMKKVKGEVLSSDTKAPIGIAKIVISKQDGSPFKTIYSDSQGKFDFEIAVEGLEVLKFIVEKKEYQPKIEYLSLSFTDQQYNTLVHLTKIAPEEPQKKPDLSPSVSSSPSPKEEVVIKREPTPVVVRKIASRIYFDLNSYQVNQESKVALDGLVNVLNQNKNKKIRIEGHTDNIGSEEFNMSMSRKRVKAIYDYLVKKGISKSRLSTKAFGESQPLVSNFDEEGRDVNRRIEFIFGE